MKKVFNLLDNSVQYGYSDSVTPLEAVVNAYCMENNLMSAWAHAMNSKESGAFYSFVDTLPVTYGQKSVCCGDWAAWIGGAA